MKRLILILILLLPILLFAQKKDSSYPTIHLKKNETNTLRNYEDSTLIVLYNKKHNDTVSLSALFHSRLDSILRLDSLTKIISFNVVVTTSYPPATIWFNYYSSNSAYFTDEMKKDIDQTPKGRVSFWIKDIKYKRSKGWTHRIKLINTSFIALHK